MTLQMFCSTGMNRCLWCSKPAGETGSGDHVPCAATIPAPWCLDATADCPRAPYFTVGSISSIREGNGAYVTDTWQWHSLHVTLIAACEYGVLVDNLIPGYIARGLIINNQLYVCVQKKGVMWLRYWEEWCQLIFSWECLELVLFKPVYIIK